MMQLRYRKTFFDPHTRSPAVHASNCVAELTNNVQLLKSAAPSLVA